MKLRTRMFLLYLLGGALPLVIFGFYMIGDTQDILARQAKQANVNLVVSANQQTEDLLDHVNMVSRFFIFDPDLERIARHEYVEYQELIDDYRNYTRFIDYGKLYADMISSYSLYVNNPSIRTNANFIAVTEEIAAEAWYQEAARADTVSHWLIVPQRPTAETGVALTRRMVTQERQDVGILVLHLREQRLLEILDTVGDTAFLILNGSQSLAEGRNNVLDYTRFSEAAEAGGGLNSLVRAVPNERNTYQGDIVIDGEDYLLTGTSLRVEGSRDRLDLLALTPYDEILSASARQNRYTYMVFAFSGILSLVLISVLSWSFSGRIRRFQKEIERTAEGELTFTQRLRGNDEITELYNHLGSIIGQIKDMNTRIQEEQLKSERFRNEQRDAELKMLTMQINPHFLYNTLETIRMKARLEEQTDIEAIAKHLGRLLRYSLESGRQDVTLAWEFEMVTAYLKIQEYRFGDRLNILVDVPEDLLNCYMMPLMVQPLVENAMVHALEMKEGDAELQVKVRAVGEDLLVTVEDNGLGITAETLETIRASLDRPFDSAEHLGLRNVHQRLRLRFGEPYGVTLESVAGEGTRVTLLMPKIAEAEAGEPI